MATELQQMIDVVAKDKGIDPSIVIGAIEDAYLAASRKVFKSDEDLRSRFNLETGQVELYAVRQIVPDVTNTSREISLSEAQELYGEEAEVGMEIEFPKDTEKLGRIAAQTAKQVIAQRVREAEREKIHGEFSLRIGEVVNATVKRFESGDIIAEIGRVEAQIPRKEQSRAENYSIGDRVRAVIKAVSKNAKGPQVILSRTDPALLIKLFEQEVPEIYDGTVIIRGAVREAGDRAKVAVFSRERDVDPVGACVGMRGTRVQAIIRELRGEKIDIVEFSEDPVTFVTKALSPARVQRVTIVDDEQRVMEVVVEDRQLSLAIGKKGQNVRLAAKLTRLEDRHQERGRKAQGGRDRSWRTSKSARRRSNRIRSACRRSTTRSWPCCVRAATTRPRKSSRPIPINWLRCPGSIADTVDAVVAAAKSQQASDAAAPEAEAPVAKSRGWRTRKRAKSRRMSRRLPVRPVSRRSEPVGGTGAELATVRIYKVAELLGLSSQEAMTCSSMRQGST